MFLKFSYLSFLSCLSCLSHLFRSCRLSRLTRLSYLSRLCVLFVLFPLFVPFVCPVCPVCPVFHLPDWVTTAVCSSPHDISTIYRFFFLLSFYYYIYTTVVSDNINIMKTTFELNFDFYQAFKQHDTQKYGKKRKAVNLKSFTLITCKLVIPKKLVNN